MPGCSSGRERAGEITIDVRFEGIAEVLQDQLLKLGRVAGVDRFSESAGDVWSARPKLFAGAAESVICKCTVLPAQIGPLCDAVLPPGGVGRSPERRWWRKRPE